MQKIKQILKETFIEIIGSILIAVGLYNFAVASEFPMTGFSGISLILYRLFGLPIGLTILYSMCRWLHFVINYWGKNSFFAHFDVF